MANILYTNNTTLKNHITSIMKVIIMRDFKFEYDE